jgi:hypothetical protein
MKSAILAVVIAAGVSGFTSCSYAQQPKKLPPHPAAAANPSVQAGKVEVPRSATTSYPGEAAATAKPNTGEPVPSGGSSTAHSLPN